MRKLPSKIQELISTPSRQQLFEVILSQKENFTFNDVMTAAAKSGLDFSVSSIQNLLRGLCFRGYLKEHTLKATKSRGRSTIHYKREL